MTILLGNITFYKRLYQDRGGKYLCLLDKKLGLTKDRLAPGWGHINFHEIINTLKEINFKGPVGIEVLPLPEDLKATQQGIVFLKKFIEGEELKV